MRFRFGVWIHRFLTPILALFLAIPPASARQSNLPLSSEAFEKNDIPAVERELREAIASGSDISSALWQIERHASSLYQSSDLGMASAWVELLERITAREWQDQMVALYAAIDRAQIQLRLGWPDLADAKRKEIDRLVAQLPASHPSRDYALAASGLFELDLALASESFERVLTLAEELDRTLAPAVLALFSNEIDSRVALARYGLARKDSGAIAQAVAALAQRVDTSSLDAQTRARHALAIADLEIRRSDPQAAQNALEQGARFLAEGGTNAASELLAHHAALRVRLALDFDLGVDSLALHEEALRTALRQILRGADASSSHTVRAFADAGGPPGFLHFGSLQDALGEWIRIVDRTVGTAAALDCALEAQAVGWLSHSERVTLDDLRNEILTGDDHALIVFVPGPYRVHVFTITRRTIRRHELPSTIELKPRRDDLDRFLATPLDADQRAKYLVSATRAADAYLPPAVRHEIAECSRWSISAMGALASLPFEAMVLSGEPIGLTRDVDRLPALPLAVRTGRKARATALAPPRAGDVLRIVAPAYSDSQRARFPELLALDFARSSIAQIESSYSANVVVTRFGSAACFPQRLESAPRVAEFFAHGVLLADSVRPSALALEPNDAFPSGLIDAEVLGRWMDPRLVILAVCGAAQGPYRAGNEGSMSLAGSLLDSGTESVIASVRRIEAHATLRLVEHLHRALAMGRSSAAALRDARKHLVAERGAVNPSEFAHLVVIGSGQRPLFTAVAVDPAAERGTRTWRWLAWAAVVAALFGAFEIVRRSLRGPRGR